MRNFLIPKLMFAVQMFDFYVPTQHSGPHWGCLWPSTVRALDIRGSDIFFEKMPKKCVIVHLGYTEAYLTFTPSIQVLPRNRVWDDFIQCCYKCMKTTPCYGTHSLVARTLALPVAPMSLPQDAPRTTSGDEPEAYSDTSYTPHSSQAQMTDDRRVDVFLLDVNANQPCPFTKHKAKEWTREQQSVCQQDMKDRRATTVEGLRELVSVYSQFLAMHFLMLESVTWTIFWRHQGLRIPLHRGN